MAIHIHVQGEEAPRLVGFDTRELARYAAGLMGLEPGSFALVEREHRPDNVWTRRARGSCSDRSAGRS